VLLLIKIVTILLIYQIPFVHAQDRYIMSRIQGSIKLDGLSDEDAWKGIEPFPMKVHIPNFGHPPSERTEILFGYDDKYLYAAGRLYVSDPSLIQSSSKKRDFMGGNSDWFGFIMDTFNDKENAVAFFTTPAGLRLDLTVFNDAQGRMPINKSWNTFWDVKTVRTDNGWFTEMRVPFSSIRFQETDGKIVMGLIVWRWIARKNEILTFPEIERKFGSWSIWKPSQAKEVVFQGIRSRKPLYVAPYLMTGFRRYFDLNDEETAYERIYNPAHELGLDVKYGLTSNLTIDVTVNTDFAQVEADNQQINLTRFSLFFPEKRLFFQERSSNFEFNLGGYSRMFYSRRIGIYEGKPVRIYGGARVVGRLGQWDVGFLNMQTAPVEDLSSENFGLIRIRRRVINPYTYVGGIVTSRLGTDGTYNVAYGVDGIFRLFEDDYLNVHWVQTFEDSLENDPVSFNPSRMSVNWVRRNVKGLGYNVSLSRSGRDFKPGLGFETREDYTRIGTKLLYGWLPGEESSLLNHNIYINGSVFLRNIDRGTESAKVGPGWEFSTKSMWGGEISVNLYYEDVPDTFSIDDRTEVPEGRYIFSGIKGSFMSPMGYLINAMVTLDAGSFYDGWRFSIGVMPTWSISSSLELSGFYEYNRVSFSSRNNELYAHIARVRALWMLNTSFSISAFVQYNGIVDEVIANVRLRYNPREGNDLYIVYDEGLNTERFREEPFLPRTSSRALILKYTYTFNL
jgi:hypothetical protein